VRYRAGSATIRALGENEVEVTVSTSNLVAQDGLMLMASGCQLDNYRKNPVWLWSHDPLTPVGRSTQIGVQGAALNAKVAFAPAGVSPKADEVRGLVKSGVISAASIGFDFDAADCEPLDPKRPHAGGKRVKRWTLLECSFVAIPADPDALVTARARALEPPQPSARVTFGRHGPYATLLDPLAPIALREELRRARHAAAMNGDPAARASLDYEGRQRELAYRTASRK
jgi:HK97 family phage prohead protease